MSQPMPQPMPHTTPAGEGFQAQTLNRLFDQLIQLTTWSCAAYIAIILVIGGEWSRLFAPTLIGLGGPACNVLRKRFSDRMGFSVYIWSIWIALAVQSGYRGGIVNPILHGCIILVLMGGWLLGMRQALLGCRLLGFAPGLCGAPKQHGRDQGAQSASGAKS